MIKPKLLEKNDKIALIAPASQCPETNKVIICQKMINELGFKSEIFPSCYLPPSLPKATDKMRAADINDAFLRDDIKALFCIRGGYGCGRILDLIDYSAIKKNPKMIIGFSDITALILSIYKNTKIPSLHAPMPYSKAENGFSDFSKKNLLRFLLYKSKNQHIENPPDEKIIGNNQGICEGILLGGNLSVICSIINTENFPDLSEKIIFIEETNESPYKIDRMLNQLKLHNVFYKCKGIIFGNFNNCTKTEESYQTEDVIDSFIREIDKPILKNLSCGHCTKNLSLPMGIKVRIDSNENTLTLIENAFS